MKGGKENMDVGFSNKQTGSGFRTVAVSCSLMLKRSSLVQKKKKKHLWAERTYRQQVFGLIGDKPML